MKDDEIVLDSIMCKFCGYEFLYEQRYRFEKETDIMPKKLRTPTCPKCRMLIGKKY